MRSIRILLLLVVVGAIAGIAVPNAKALGYEDEPCPPQSQLKVCKPDAEVGKAYSITIVGKGGCYPDSVRYSVVSGALPPGLTLTSGRDAVISGVPTQPGQYKFWLQIQDILASQGGASWCTTADSSCGCARTSQWQFQITVNPGLQIQQRQGTLTAAQLNQPYNLQLTATGGTGLTWSVASGALPAGLSLNPSTGLLSGTPTATGEFHFQIKVTDGNRSDIQTYTLNVVEPLRIAKANGVAEVGLPFELALQASGGRAPYTWSATGLPDGLTLNPATGKISGTPTASTAGSVKVTVTDSLGVATSLTVPLPVVDRLAVARGPLPTAKVGGTYSFRLTTVGGARPFSWTVLRGLPAGLKLNAKTGRLYGVPRKAGTYRFRVQVTDGLGARASLGVVLKVSAGGAKARR